MRFLSRLNFIHALVVFSVIASISACGKKDEEGAAPGSAPPAVNPSPVSTPGDNSGAVSQAAIAQEISGTYTGTLFTKFDEKKGRVTVTVVANEFLDIGVSITNAKLQGNLGFVSQFYGYDGEDLEYFAPDLGSVGVATIDKRRVWVTDAYIDRTLSGAPQLYLRLQAVYWDQDKFGPWNIFYWQSYWTEYDGWINIRNLTKKSS